MSSDDAQPVLAPRTTTIPDIRLVRADPETANDFRPWPSVGAPLTLDLCVLGGC